MEFWFDTIFGVIDFSDSSRGHFRSKSNYLYHAVQKFHSKFYKGSENRVWIFKNWKIAKKFSVYSKTRVFGSLNTVLHTISQNFFLKKMNFYVINIQSNFNKKYQICGTLWINFLFKAQEELISNLLKLYLLFYFFQNMTSISQG